VFGNKKKIENLELELKELKNEISSLYAKYNKIGRLMKYPPIQHIGDDRGCGWNYNLVCRRPSDDNYKYYEEIRYETILYIYRYGEEFGINLRELYTNYLTRGDIIEIDIKEDDIAYVTILNNNYKTIYNFVIDYKNGNYICKKSDVKKVDSK
jgi:hypothetical protein